MTDNNNLWEVASPVFVFFNIYLFIWLHRVLLWHVNSSLQRVGSDVAVPWLSCSLACNIGFLTRDQTHVPCIAKQILNDWTTKEVSHCNFNLHFPDDEHLLKKLLAIHIPSLERYLPKYFIHSKTGLFV